MPACSPNLVADANNLELIQLWSSSSSLQRKATEATSSSGPDNRIEDSHGPIVCLSVPAFAPIYFTLGWPHLEYTLQACSPNLAADADCLKPIQRLATRLVKGFRRLPFEKRLRRLDLHSVRRHRLHGDFIAGLDPSTFFIPPVQPGSRGHPFKVR